MHAGWAVVIGMTGLICLLPGCRDDAGDGAGESAVRSATTPDGPMLVNDAWRIVKMATAHDVFTIEVEVVDAATAAAVARRLVQPLTAQYTEILVYVYAEGEGDGGHLPMTRVEWTAEKGFVEVVY